MKFLIPPVSPATQLPFYEQIIASIKSEVGSGRLPPHTPLPSFRALAADLMVSIITVKRAYEELERDGIIYRKQGLGTFVAEKGAEQSRKIKGEHARELLRQALHEGLEAGLCASELMDMTRQILTEEEQ